MSVPAPPSRADVLVIGAGVAGLTAARAVLLARPTARVVVIDGSAQVGGALRRALVAGHLVDVGAESMLARRPEAVDLVTSLGHGQDLVAPATTAASLWSRGRVVPLPRAQIMGVPTDPEAFADVLDPAELARCREVQPWPDGAVRQDVSVGTYVGTRLGRAVIDRLVDPLLGGVYAGNADRLSLQATMPALWDVARRDAPLSELIRPVTDPARPVFAGLVGGVGRLPELLTQDITARGGAVRVRSMARELRREGQGWVVTMGPTNQESVVRSRSVVVAIPAANAARLLHDVAPQAAGQLRTIETASSAVISLAVRRRSAAPLSGSGLLVPAVDARPIKAATFSSNKWAWTDALDPELFFLRGSIGRAGEVSPLQRDDQALMAEAVRGIEAAVGGARLEVVDAHVQRWGGGLPQYAVGHVDLVERVRRSVGAQPGLAVAGATYDGVGIPAVIASAHTAADIVVSHLDSTQQAPISAEEIA